MLRLLQKTPSLVGLGNGIVRGMAGHSKWKTIQHRKGALDAKKAQIFAKIGNQIRAASVAGGSDPRFNSSLTQLILRAEAVDMPKEKIERAMARGNAKKVGEDVIYEGHGPGGVALLVTAYTDNRNRTAQNIRHIFTKKGGTMGGQGSVAWKFSRLGVLTVSELPESEFDQLFDVATDNGAEDVEYLEDNEAEVVVSPENIGKMRKVLEGKFKVDHGCIEFRPVEITSVDDATAANITSMVEEFRAMEDVTDVAHDADT